MEQPLPKLTQRQQDILTYIKGRIEEWGYPPTIREIGEFFSIRSTNGVVDHLKALKRKGYLAQSDMKSRTLRLAQQPGSHGAGDSDSDSADGLVKTIIGQGKNLLEVPILGRVAAGEPILAEERAEGTVIIDSMMVGRGKKVFALKVVGNSMIEDGIHDGDFIFVQKKNDAEPGAIVVVVIENEATCKRYYPEGDRIRLQPANALLKPIFINKADFREVQIVGIVVGVYRQV